MHNMNKVVKATLIVSQPLSKMLVFYLTRFNILLSFDNAVTDFPLRMSVHFILLHSTWVFGVVLFWLGLRCLLLFDVSTYTLILATSL